MSIIVTISDDLAAALEAMRKETGMPSLDAAAEAMLSHAILMDASDVDDLGLSEDALRLLIAEGEASGPASSWDPEAVRAEVRRRFAGRKAG
jgi:hypothetical protein